MVRRDGEILRTMATGDEEYVDNAVSPGSHRYCLRPVIGGVEQDGRECCEILVRATPIAGVGCAYLYGTDAAGAEEFKALLESEGISTDLYRTDEAALVDFSTYSVTLVGSDSEQAWGSPGIVRAIDGSGTSIIGLGEGGYYFFGQLGLAIGSPWGWHGGNTGVYVVDPSHPVFHQPNLIAPGADPFQLELYGSTGHVGIYLTEIPQDVHVLGREVGDSNHYPLLLEKEKYLLWGFTGSPSSMTDPGRLLFINCVSFYAGLRCGGKSQCTRFVRGDVDGTGVINLSDPIFLLTHLFRGGETPTCLDAGDVNNDGTLGLTDAIYSLTFQFLGGDPPSSPYPDCGIDPAVNGLGCLSYLGCD